ncbi:hypothetical protein [Mycoplasma hafezii]|uniref:hypothetical protein n=1 Tax=Mycoplasma hafezii TaxID=525886 RepID=UPI003CF9E87E
MKINKNLSQESEYVSKLISCTNENNDVYSFIAKELLNNVNSKIQIKHAKDFCETIGVSPAAFSYFSKRIGFENVKELVFIHNQIIKVNTNVKKEIVDQTVQEAARLIDLAHKILFIGVSGAAGLNLDLQLSLLRMDKNAILVYNKYEQIGLSRLLKSNDVMIVNSISLQHKWMINIIKQTEAKVILISSWIPKEIQNKVNVYFQVETDERTDGLRLFTSKGREKTLVFYKDIFKELRNNKSNFENLQKSSYQNIKNSK